MLKPNEKSVRASRFLSQEDGSVAILSAVALVAMIGTAGLALEYGNALLVKNTTQRAIDLAVYSAAVEYTESGDKDRMKATAANVLRLNGVDPGTLEFEWPEGALRGKVSTSAPLGLTRVIRDDTSVEIGVSATALLGEEKQSCITALDSDGSGIDIRGTVSINAQDCPIASGSSIEARGCTYKITTSKLKYGSATKPDLCDSDNNVTTSDGDPAPIESGSPEDPLKDSDAREKASELLAAISGFDGPEITLSKKNEDPTDKVEEVEGCTAADNGSDGSIWTVSCGGKSEYEFGKITVESGYSLIFENKGKYLIGGDINIESSGSLKLGGGTYQIEGAIESNGAANLGGGTYALTNYIDINGSLNAKNVTLLIDGKERSSTCKTSRTAFCIANGDEVALSPPDSGVFQDIAVMGPFNPPNGNAEIKTGNTHMNATGKFYFPEGNLEIDGNGSVSGTCLELITKKLYLRGTVSITTKNCDAGATSDNGDVRLIK